MKKSNKKKLSLEELKKELKTIELEDRFEMVQLTAAEKVCCGDGQCDNGTCKPSTVSSEG